MRDLAVMICYLLVEALAQCQSFNKRYDFMGWGYAQTAFNIEIRPDGFITIGGGTDHDTIGPGQVFSHGSVHLTMIDLYGQKLWEKRAFRPFHTSLPGWSNCCDTIPGGGYVVGGTSEDTTGFDEVYLMRFDAQGDTLWTRVFGDPGGNEFWIGQQVKRTNDGGFVIAGFTEQGNWSGFALKTDSLGNELWRRTYGWSPAYSDGIGAVEASLTGDLFMAGTRFLNDGTGDNWVQRTDSVGNVIWSVSWGGSYSEGSCNITNTSNGDLLVFSGRGYGPSYSLMRPYVARLDSTDGSILWEHEFGPILPGQHFLSGKECPNGKIIAAGRTFEQPGPSVQKGLLALTSATGDSLWKYYYFYVDTLVSTGQGTFYDVIPTADGGFIAAGTVNNPVGQGNPPGYSQDTWVVKVDSLGCIVPGCNSVGITEQATNLLDAISIFPNPAHDGQQVTVQITLPPSVAHLPMQLSVVGMDGRVVQQQRIAGNGAHQLALPAVSAGLYYIHLAADGKWLTGGKLMIQ